MGESQKHRSNSSNNPRCQEPHKRKCFSLKGPIEANRHHQKCSCGMRCRPPRLLQYVASRPLPTEHPLIEYSGRQSNQQATRNRREPKNDPWPVIGETSLPKCAPGKQYGEAEDVVCSQKAHPGMCALYFCPMQREVTEQHCDKWHNQNGDWERQTGGIQRKGHVAGLKQCTSCALFFINLLHPL